MQQRTHTTPGGGRSRAARHPSPAKCRRLLVAHQVPEHIRRHSSRVAQVARRVAEGLQDHRGEPVDVALVEAGALLHDIAKALCFDSHLDHAAEGGRILRGLGLDAVAVLVERHVFLGAWDPEGAVTEAEIVNYADKRVRNDQVVSLAERFDDLLVRYGRSPEIELRIRGNWAVMAAVEAKIFARLPFTPAEVRPPRPARRGH